MPIKPNADEIIVPEGLEPVRKRPEMYVGPLPDPRMANRLVEEVLCLSIDEAFCGRCTEISVAVDAFDTITVRDNGPGLPMEPNRHGHVRAEVMMTCLFACREAKQSEGGKNACCEIGLAVANALSEWMRLRVFRDGGCWAQEYRRGVVQCPFRREADTSETGLEFSFRPDGGLLGRTMFDARALSQWLSGTGLQFESFDQHPPRALPGEPVSLRFKGITPCSASE